MNTDKRYCFLPTENNQPEKNGEFIGLAEDFSFCFTIFQDGHFFPRVKFYLAEDDGLLDRYVAASYEEVIEGLNKKIETLSGQQFELRDMFACAALIGEFIACRGLPLQKAAALSFEVADEMMKLRGKG